MLMYSENEMSCMCFEIWENRNRCNLINVRRETASVPELAAANDWGTKPQNRQHLARYMSIFLDFQYSALRSALSLLRICLRVHTWLALNSIRPYLITYKWHASYQRARKVTHYYIVRFSKRTSLKSHGASSKLHLRPVLPLCKLSAALRNSAKLYPTTNTNAPTIRTSLKGLFDSRLRYVTKQSSNE